RWFGRRGKRMHKTKTTAAQVIVECIKREGIGYVFCVPGESYLPLLDALYDEPAIRLISARHEGGAAFMAEGYAQSSLKPGVVLATRGVGAANLSIGVHTAYQDSTPMIVFLGQVHSQFRKREGFQEIDLERYFSPIAKWAVEVTDPDRMSELVQRAFRIAQTGRPGPVVVSLPEDVLASEAGMHYAPAVVKPQPAPASSEVHAVEAVLRKAKRPLIIAGGGVKNACSEDKLVSFAEKFHIPVMVAFRRHDVFPNDHPLYTDHLRLSTDGQILDTVQRADTILALGTRLSEITTQDYSIIDSEQTLVHVDIDAATIGKVYQPEVGIVADMSEALKAFLAMDVAQSWLDWTADRREAYVSVSRLTDPDDDDLIKQIIFRLQEQLSEDVLLTNDAGNFAGWLHAFYSFTRKHSYVGPTSGAMGYGLPAALGAQLAFPEKQVVSLSGDGGFMMTAAELETAVRYNIPVICLVFNNKMYGTIRMHQEKHYPEKVIGTGLGDVSFVDLAK